MDFVLLLVRLLTALVPVKRWRKRLRRSLINRVQQRELRARVPVVRARYAKHLEACRAKHARGEKLRVAFFVLDGAMFSAEPIYRLMAASNAFEPEILVIPDVERGPDFTRVRQERALAALQARHLAARALYNLDTGAAEDISGRYDLVFTSNPYAGATLPQYTAAELHRHALVAFVSYGYGGYLQVDTRRFVFRPEVSLFWRMYVPVEATRRRWVAANPLLEGNCVVGGYPKMDRLASLKCPAPARPRVILASHHSLARVSDGLTLSNFLRYADFYLELPARYPQIDFVFRPHPLLRERLSRDEWWGRARTDAYFARMAAIPNVTYEDGGDYFETFLSSSALIHDCASFLAEYFYTGNPQCYLLADPRKIDAEFSSFGKDLLRHCTLAYDEEAIMAFIDRVVLAGEDPGAEERRAFAAREVCAFHPHAADHILSDIEDAIGIRPSGRGGKTVALVFAGGSGVRMGASVPKQFLDLNGKPVLAHTLALFERHPDVDEIVLVLHADYVSTAGAFAARHGIAKVAHVVAGGETAQDSIYNGLKKMAEVYPPDTVVLIHDGVRPYVGADVISANVRTVREKGNAVTYTPCYETIVLSEDGSSIDALPCRRESYTAQAPQGFRLGDILAAHERIRARPEGYRDMVDQATICWTLGTRIHLVPGNRGNIKVTTPEDLLMLEALLRKGDVR